MSTAEMTAVKCSMCRSRQLVPMPGVPDLLGCPNCDLKGHCDATGEDHQINHGAKMTTWSKETYDGVGPTRGRPEGMI